MSTTYDFSGWATRNDVRCADGRTIRRNAFAHQDGETVPLVWNHDHDDVNKVLGHALLENRKDGVYAYCSFNKSENGKAAKETVRHGDVGYLSIYANHLQQSDRGDVIHGAIREVSLVLAGANPEARIESFMSHSGLDDEGEEGVLFTAGAFGIDLAHSDDYDDDDEYEEDDEYYDDEEDEDEEEEEMANNSRYLNHSDEEDIEEIFNGMTDEQLGAVYAVVEDIVNNGGEAEDSDEDYDEEYDDADEYDDEEYDDDEYEDEYEEDADMKHNVFDSDYESGAYITQDDIDQIFSDAQRCGSLKESYIQHTDMLEDDFLAHAEHATDTPSRYGIMPKMDGTTPVEGSYGIDALFPDYKNLNNPPEWIKRDTDWVAGVMNSVHHTPFSRIKSMFADITEDDARARGYMKGNYKKEEVFSLLKRTTDPQTIYKKQRLDRDDVIDITDFDVVAWIKAEMRMMLDEEIARAILVGDGRVADSDDKIQQAHVRSIYNDDDFYSNKVAVQVAANADDEATAKATIKAVIKARKDYKGSGNPTFYTTTDVLTNMLLIEDGIGHRLYKTEQELATALRVSKIVEVPVMENLTRTFTEGTTSVTLPLIGIIVNLADYNVGADKGGAVNMFDDFDIDYNQMKYLIETRMSGALIKPHSAMVIELKKGVAAQG